MIMTSSFCPLTLKHASRLKIAVYIVHLPDRQATLCLQDICLKVLTVHVNALRMFLGKVIPATLIIDVMRSSRYYL